MPVTEKFTLRISPDDREIFAELQRLLKRTSQSDAIRFVAREAVKAFHAVEASEGKPNRGTKTKST